MMKLLAPCCALLLAATVWPAAAQTWDTSGNGQLNGTFYFREVFYVVGDGYGNLSDALALYGTVTFDGNGKYTMSATELDEAAGGTQNITLSGTYSISASGHGFISNPLSSGDAVYGLVAKNGIFVGSSTENGGFNDIFVAAPLSTQTSLATFKGSYWIADFDLSNGTPGSTISAMFQVNPDGAGNLGNFTVTGYVGQGGSSLYQQSLTRISYNLSNNAFNLSIPTSNNLISGQQFLYISPDGNFVFGGSPVSANFLVGVRTGTGAPNFSGLYYQAGIDQPFDGNVGYLDTYYGSINGGNGAAIGHQRIADAFSGSAYDYTYGESYTVGSDGTYKDSYSRHVVGAGGAVRIASGIGPYLGLNVAVAAPSLSGSGVFLNPQGIVNAGGWSPFTAPIAPGEFITLFGSGLAPDGLPVTNSVPFPTSIGGVQVTINGTAAPLYYATPTSIVAIVPYGITGSVAQIQVNNNGNLSNMVSTYIGMTAPGVFTQTQNGLGYGSIQHADYSLVTASHPAAPGETLTVYMTGLGAVSPAVGDGEAAPSGSLSSTTGTMTATIGGNAATVSFAGLVPGSVALYQMNVVVPAKASTGDNLLAITGPDSYSAEATIPVGTTSSGTAAATPRAIGPRFAKAPKGARRANARQ